MNVNLRNYFVIFREVILCDKIGRQVRKLFRNKSERKRLTNHNFTILSQNCIGSIWYHDLGERFCSPTINIKFNPDDFVKFLGNIKHYLDAPIKFVEDAAKPYPVGYLDDVYIEFVHYHSEHEVVSKWKERRKRINWNNMCIIACDGGMSDNARDLYLNLPIPNKILFTSRIDSQEHNAMHVTVISCPQFNDSAGADARLLNFCSVTGKRYYNNLIDYVDFLNSVKRL